VLAVVLYHANLGHVSGGFVGVDVFFVISGFLITRQLVSSVGRDGLRALPTFYTRRIRRLLPAGVAVVVATVLVARFFAPALQVRSIALDGLYTTFYGLNYRLAIEGTQYLHATDAVSPLQHFWSLGVEEQFYVAWPLVIVLCAWAGRRFRTPLLVAVLAAVVAVSFHYSVTVTKTNAPWAYFSLHTRAWELAIGALVAIGSLYLARLPRWIAAPGGWAGLIAIVVSAFGFNGATPYPGSAAAVPVVAAGVVLACGCGSRRSVEKVLAEPMLQCIGRISYSWYLWHWPMLVLAPEILGHPLSWLQRGCVVWLSFVAAIVTYFAIENPGRLLARTNWQWFLSGGLLSAAVACVSVAAILYPPSLTGSGAAVTVAQADAATPAALRQVQAAIAAGVATKAAPSNLTPQPARAAKDLPPSSSDGCHADFLVIDQGACVFGDPAGRQAAVLFGDSHMEQWLPAFDLAGKRGHWRVINWTKAACPPAQLSVFAPTLNRQYSECDTWRQRTIARIAALKPNLVVVGQSENVASSSVSASTYAAATVQTLTQLKSATHARVEFIQDLPVPNFDAPTCVADHLSDVSPCTFPLDKAYRYPDRHQAMAPALRQAGIPVLDPQQWLCTSQRCPAVVGNLLVYRNDTHVTSSFSSWLMPMVAPLLTGAR
jgi:peptidoglycan/LPS O-acetylase OafA/YrhL